MLRCVLAAGIGVLPSHELTATLIVGLILVAESLRELVERIALTHRRNVPADIDLIWKSRIIGGVGSAEECEVRTTVRNISNRS